MTKKQQKRKAKREHKLSIHLEKISKINFEKQKDGKDILRIIVDEGRLVHGFKNLNDKSKSSIIIPSVFININTLFKSDSHFCFVDTNKLKKTLTSDTNYTHLTGIYIFTVKEFQEYDGGAKINTDYENSIISIWKIDAKSHKKSERIGWDCAIKTLQEIGARNARIFVDSDQKELKELNKELPQGYEYYYVSADYQTTIYNKIFSRLDKLINLTEKYDAIIFNKYRVIDYLWGNIDHLDKQEYMNKEI